MNHKQSLINSLVSIAGDYQKVDFNSSHVQRWVEQFPDDSHKVLLRNLVSILEKTYYSKNEVEVFFQNVLQDDSIFLEPLYYITLFFSLINAEILFFLFVRPSISKGI